MRQTVFRFAPFDGATHASSPAAVVVARTEANVLVDRTEAKAVKADGVDVIGGGGASGARGAHRDRTIEAFDEIGLSFDAAAAAATAAAYRRVVMSRSTSMETIAAPMDVFDQWVATFDELPVPVATLTSGGTITYANAAFWHCSGHTPAAQHIQTLFPDVSLQLAMEPSPQKPLKHAAHRLDADDGAVCADDATTPSASNVLVRTGRITSLAPGGINDADLRWQMRPVLAVFSSDPKTDDPTTTEPTSATSGGNPSGRPSPTTAGEAADVSRRSVMRDGVCHSAWLFTLADRKLSSRALLADFVPEDVLKNCDAAQAFWPTHHPRARLLLVRLLHRPTAAAAAAAPPTPSRAQIAQRTFAPTSTAAQTVSAQTAAAASGAAHCPEPCHARHFAPGGAAAPRLVPRTAPSAPCPGPSRGIGPEEVHDEDLDEAVAEVRAQARRHHLAGARLILSTANCVVEDPAGDHPVLYSPKVLRFVSVDPCDETSVDAFAASLLAPNNARPPLGARHVAHTAAGNANAHVGTAAFATSEAASDDKRWTAAVLCLGGPIVSGLFGDGLASYTAFATHSKHMCRQLDQLVALSPGLHLRLLNPV